MDSICGYVFMAMCMDMCLWIVFMDIGLWVRMGMCLGYVFGLYVWVPGLDLPRGLVQQIPGLTSPWGPFPPFLGLTPPRGPFPQFLGLTPPRGPFHNPWVLLLHEAHFG
jgi:hypothetical protein